MKAPVWIPRDIYYKIVPLHYASADISLSYFPLSLMIPQSCCGCLSCCRCVAATVRLLGFRLVATFAPTALQIRQRCCCCHYCLQPSDAEIGRADVICNKRQTSNRADRKHSSQQMNEQVAGGEKRHATGTMYTLM